MNNLQFLRALDKYDRLGASGVRQLLTTGRKDDSGDFTPGCGPSEAAADCVLAFLACGKTSSSNQETIARMVRWFAVITMPPDELDALLDAVDRLGLVERDAQ